MRIRYRLLILLLAVLIPVFVGATIGIAYEYNEQQQSFRHNMQEITHALAQVLDKELANREILLRTLAASPVLDDEDLQTFYDHAKALASTWDTTIILSEPSGQQILNTRQPLGTKNLPRSKPLMELREKLGPDATVISDLYFAPIGKQYSFAMQVPVKRDGLTLFYLSMGNFSSHLQHVLEEQRVPQEWNANIIDRKGVVMARSKEPVNFVGTYIGDTRWAKLAGKEEGFHESVSLQGVPVIAFYSRVQRAGWTFLVSVPKSVLLQPAIHAAAVLGSICALLLGAAILAALVLGRQTAKSIEALRLSAEQLGRGEPVSPQPSDVIEINAVNAAMITASARLQSSKAHLEQQVAEAVAASEKSQRTRLQGQKLEALGRLTGGIAHDFNNVLQTLTIGLQTLLFSARDEREKSLLESCRRAVQRGAELSRQLMVFGRVQDAILETIDIRQQIEAAMMLTKATLPTDIEFRLEMANGLWPVTLDPLQFELALLNLVMNARDAMPHGGLLRVTACNETLAAPVDNLPPGDYIKCCVIDTGEGMPPEVLAHALDPFFTTKSVGKGSGMGLAQAYGFAKQSGGTLTLASAPGEGTRVALYLPRAVSMPGATDAPNAAPAAANAAMRDAQGRIMFVEDDALVRAAVKPALEEAGFRVTIAENAEQAMELLAATDAEERFDLVFSDIVMPGKFSGIDLAEYVRQRYPLIKVVLATGYSERRVDMHGVRLLAKPYGSEEVVTLLSAVLAQGGAEVV